MWYREVLDLELAAEFAEQGPVRGAQLVDPTTGLGIALREREFCASRPDLTGFDPFAIEVESLDALHALAARCDGLGVAHGGVRDRGAYGANHPIVPGRFLGVEFTVDGQSTVYASPRLG